MTDLNIELTIKSRNNLYKPIIEENITVEWEIEGAPGKLTFKLLNDKKIDFLEGDSVSLIVNNVKLFYGFVFTKKRDKQQLITVTCYDQLRYLKNKDCIKYLSTASELIKSIAEDYMLKCGSIEDTSISISKREDNVSLFDIINNALKDTKALGGKVFVIYDDFGQITLKSTGTMKLDCLVCGETTENFDYESSIDNNTYNSIRLSYEDKDGKRDIYDFSDSGNIKRWGVLQYFENLSDNIGVASKGKNLLDLYNIKRRSLRVTGVLGDLRVRAGCLLPVKLILGDVDADEYLIVETVKHIFKNGSHTMDLKLRGGKFV